MNLELISLNSVCIASNDGGMERIDQRYAPSSQIPLVASTNPPLRSQIPSSTAPSKSTKDSASPGVSSSKSFVLLPSSLPRKFQSHATADPSPFSSTRRLSAYPPAVNSSTPSPRNTRPISFRGERSERARPNLRFIGNSLRACRCLLDSRMARMGACRLRLTRLDRLLLVIVSCRLLNRGFRQVRCFLLSFKKGVR